MEDNKEKSKETLNYLESLINLMVKDESRRSLIKLYVVLQISLDTNTFLWALKPNEFDEEKIAMSIEVLSKVDNFEKIMIAPSPAFELENGRILEVNTYSTKGIDASLSILDDEELKVNAPKNLLEYNKEKIKRKLIDDLINEVVNCLNYALNNSYTKAVYIYNLFSNICRIINDDKLIYYVDMRFTKYDAYLKLKEKFRLESEDILNKMNNEIFTTTKIN